MNFPKPSQVPSEADIDSKPQLLPGKHCDATNNFGGRSKSSAVNFFSKMAEDSLIASWIGSSHCCQTRHECYRM